MKPFNSVIEAARAACNVLSATVVRRRPRSVSALPLAGRGASCHDLRPSSHCAGNVSAAFAASGLPLASAPAITQATPTIPSWRTALRPLRRLFACIGVASASWLLLAHSASAQGTSFEVSNIDQPTSSASTDLGSSDLSQGFRTAAHIDAYTGYTVTSVGIAFGDVSSSNSVPTVSIVKTATASHSERKIADLTPPASLSANSVNTWTATGVQLEPYTFYAVRVDSAGGQSNRGNRIRQTSSGSEASSGVSGWHISDQFLYRGASGGNWYGTSGSLKIRISGTANPAVAPDVASVTRHSPSASPTNADSLVWRVAFSKPVRNVDAADFTASGTTATLAVAKADRVGMTYDVTLSGGDLADLEGTATLAFASGHSIEDLDGRTLSGTAPTGRNDASYAVDNTGPTILHVRARDNVEHGTNAAVLAWHVTFSEPIVDLDPQNVYFAIDGEWHERMSGRAQVRRVTGSVWEISADHRMRFNDVQHLLNQVDGHSHDHTGEGHSHEGTFTAHVVHDQDTTIADLAGNLLTTELDRPGPGEQRSVPSPSFTTQPVEVDRDVPQFVRGVIHGSTIILGYDEVLDRNSVPAADAFTLKVDGIKVRLDRTTPVRIQGMGVTLRLAKAIALPQLLRLDYTVPDANAVRDRAGNEVSDITDEFIFYTDWVPPTERVPTAADATVSTAEDTDHSFTLADFNGQTGGYLTGVQITSLPPAGAGTLNFDGAAIAANRLPRFVTAEDLEETKLTYTPPANANGDGYATFSYKVKNPTHFSADAYTMTIDVTPVNDAAAGLPTISGNARAGATLSADVSAITDAVDGLTKAAAGDEGHAFSYQWVRVAGTGEAASETAIPGATASTYRLVQADVAGKVKVQASFTDDDGHEETLTSAVYPSSGSVAGGITAAFEDLPQSHDGATRFSVRLAFSRNIASLSYQWLRAHLLSATGGRVVSAKRETRGENRNWRITLAPSGTDDVTLRLAALRCGTQYAVCDGGTPLAEAVSVTVAYQGEATETPEPETETFGAELVLRTHSHNGAGGSGKFRLYFRSAPHGLSFRQLAPRALLISGGAVSGVKRSPPGQNRVWEVTVAPEGNGDIGVALKTTTDCDTGICTADGAMFASDSTLTIPGPSLFSVADAQVEEAEGAALVFTVTLSRARTHHSSWVSYATADGTATAGSDYTAASGRLTFAAGETSKTVRVAVLDDTHDEGDETLTLTLSSPIPAGYTRIGDGVATGTIRNTDAMPKAWTARFGRTVAEQVLETVDSRMQAARTPGVEVTVAGARLDGQTQTTEASGADEAAAGQPLALADWLRDATDPNAEDPRSRAISNRDLLLGSTFLLTAADDAPGTGGATYSLWGRSAVSNFDGHDGDLTVNGEVVSAMLGADWSRGHVLAGLIVGHSSGDGGYRAPSGGGTVSSTLTGLYPWGRYALSERLDVWAAAGYGEGRLTLTPDGRDAIRADLDLWMGAIGLRGALVDGGANGLSLTSKTDALLVETSTAAVAGLAATASGVTRLRLAVEGTLPVRLSNGWVVTPAVELGLRHDGGDAETGFGLDVGAGLAWRADRLGLSAEIRGRGLVTHEASGFRDVGLSGSLAWRPAVDERGPSLSLAQTYGGSSTGGVGALLERGTLSGLSATGAGEELGALHRQRLEARFGYGVPAFGDSFTWIPEVGVGVSETARDYRLGWRLVRVERGSASAVGRLELSLEAMRRESAVDAAAGPEHAVGMRLTSPF